MATKRIRYDILGVEQLRIQQASGAGYLPVADANGDITLTDSATLYLAKSPTSATRNQVTPSSTSYPILSQSGVVGTGAALIDLAPSRSNMPILRVTTTGTLANGDGGYPLIQLTTSVAFTGNMIDITMGSSATAQALYATGGSGSNALVYLESTARTGHLVEMRNTGASAKAALMVTDATNYSFIWKDGSVIVKGITSTTPIFDFDLYGKMYQAAKDTGTVNALEVTRFGHRTSGTPSTLFGTQVTFYADTSNNTFAEAGHIEVHWATATNGSQKGRMILRATDNSAAREGFRVETNGSAAMISFFAGAAATVQTVTGSRAGNAALASLLTGLANYGLIVNSSSA